MVSFSCISVSYTLVLGWVINGLAALNYNNTKVEPKINPMTFTHESLLYINVTDSHLNGATVSCIAVTSLHGTVNRSALLLIQGKTERQRQREFV